MRGVNGRHVGTTGRPCHAQPQLPSPSVDRLVSQHAPATFPLPSHYALHDTPLVLPVSYGQFGCYFFQFHCMIAGPHSHAASSLHVWAAAFYVLDLCYMHTCTPI